MGILRRHDFGRKCCWITAHTPLPVLPDDEGDHSHNIQNLYNTTSTFHLRVDGSVSFHD
jgi:hypothetical protein